MMCGMQITMQGISGYENVANNDQIDTIYVTYFALSVAICNNCKG